MPPILTLSFRHSPKFAQQQPDKMRVYLLEFVDKTKIVRIAPLPKEIATGIAWARILPVVVTF